MGKGTPGLYSSTAAATGAAPQSFVLTNLGVGQLSPATGSTAGGSNVLLTGAGFGTTANTQVLMDGVALPGAGIVSVTGTQIVFTAPAHAAGSVTVTVAVNGMPLGGGATYTYGVVKALPGAGPSGPA